MNESPTTAVITGLGVAAPTGLGAKAHWEAVLSGKNTIGEITKFDALGYPLRLAGEVRGFDAMEHVPARLVHETDLMTQLAFVATEEALRDAEVDPAAQSEYEMSVVTANSFGGAEFGQHELQNLYQEGPHSVGAYMSIAWFYAATTGQLSIRHGMRGACGVIASEQAGGLDVLGHARRLLAKGSRLVLCGGTDAATTPYCLVAQYTTGLMSEQTGPTRAYLPFDVDASGYVGADGTAIVIVEDAVAARRRGARIYGEIIGYAATFDPRPDSGREPTLQRAITHALADAAMSPSDVDVVFADGYAVPDRDLQEAVALNVVFGRRGVPVTVPKTMTGRLYAGGATLDVATALLAMQEGVIPPTANVTELASGCDIDLVRGEAREMPLGVALVLARGNGGFNAALIVRAVR